MLLSAVSVLVVAQSSSEFPEGLMNNPVNVRSFWQIIMRVTKVDGWQQNRIISIRYFTVMTSTTSTYKDAHFVYQSSVIIHCIMVVTTRTGQVMVSPVSKRLYTCIHCVRLHVHWPSFNTITRALYIGLYDIYFDHNWVPCLGNPQAP